jgi:hypothetical protein
MGRRRAQISVLLVAQESPWLASPKRQVVITIDDPGIAGFAGEKREFADGDDRPVVVILTPGGWIDAPPWSMLCFLLV